MKFGQTLKLETVPQWVPYNIDYNDLKNLIKVHTTKDQAQAIAIPGQADTALEIFEDSFLNELYNQHERVDLFVKSKSDEIGRRLQFFQDGVVRLLNRLTYSNGKPMSQKRRAKFAKYDAQIERCRDDTKSLQQFVATQKTAFHKIIKKYKKWTGSATLGPRFDAVVAVKSKSLDYWNFESLIFQANDLLARLRASTPEHSGPTTPSTRSLRRSSVQVARPCPRQTYWNEYDDGDEAENEPYTIYIDPDADESFPGSKMLQQVLSPLKAPVEKIKCWLSPPPTNEERSLLGTPTGEGNGNGHSSTSGSPGGYFTETDVDDDGYDSLAEFPGGYATHYATFPSVRDQRYSQKYIQYRQKILFRGTAAAFAASVLLFVVASLLVATGKHKLRVEVDVGAITGAVASMFFATLGLGTMIYSSNGLSWLYKGCVTILFVAMCLLNGFLLTVVVEHAGL